MEEPIVEKNENQEMDGPVIYKVVDDRSVLISSYVMLNTLRISICPDLDNAVLICGECCNSLRIIPVQSGCIGGCFVQVHLELCSLKSIVNITVLVLPESDLVYRSAA